MPRTPHGTLFIRRDAAAISALLAISLAANWLLASSLSVERRKQPFTSLDGEYIERSIAAYSASIHLDREAAMAHRFPVVARTATGVCVNLKLERGLIGTTPVSCYDGGGKLVYRGSV